MESQDYYIIPIGPQCQCAQTIQNLKIRVASYPFDWIRDTTIQDVVNILENRHNFDVTRWNKFSNMSYYMPHDYKDDSHNASELLFEGGDLISKYKRRFERLFRVLDSGKPIYFLRFGDNRDIEKLQNLFPQSTIIHIPDGHPDSKDTHRKIYETVKFKIDPYSFFISVLVGRCGRDGIAIPVSNRGIHELVMNDYRDFVQNNDPKDDVLVSMTELLDTCFSELDLVWTSQEELYRYVFNKFKELTNIEYPLH